MAQQGWTVRLSAVETVEIEPCIQQDPAQSTVRLTFRVGTVAMLTKHIRPEAAHALADAFGFAFNDCARPQAAA